MDLREQLTVLRRRWVTVLLSLIFVVAGTALVSAVITPRYTASTELFFGVEGGTSVSDLNQGSSYTQQQMSSYVRVATSPLVLEPVIKSLGLPTTPDQLGKSVVATAPLNTVILEIDVTDENAARSAQIANALGTQVTRVADKLAPARSDGRNAVQVTVLAPASVPGSPSAPQIPLYLGIAAALGLVLGVVIALLRDALNSKIRSAREVRDVTDRPILGMIPTFADDATGPRVEGQSSVHVPWRFDPHSEAMRRLRANFQFIDLTTPTKTVLISSSVPDEGKTTTAINLGMALAEAGQRVLVVDADLHWPAVADCLGLESQPGLTSVLLGTTELSAALHTWQDTSLSVLTAGELPPTAGDLLGTKQMGDLMIRLTEQFDVVIVDSPPLLLVPDGLVLSKIVDGTIIVAGSGQIHRRQLASSLDALQTIDVAPIGIVLNRVKSRNLPSYGADAVRAPDWQLPRTAVRAGR